MSEACERIGITAADVATHRFRTTSSHLTSEGWVLYQRCSCGQTRVLLNSEPVGMIRPPARLG